MASISYSHSTAFDPANATALTLDPRVYNGKNCRYSTQVKIDGAGNTILTLINTSNRRSQSFNLGQGAIAFSIDFSDNRAAVNLAGGSFTDIIKGGSAFGNVINGGDGNDRLESSGEFTYFVGGGGDSDKVNFEDSRVPVVASLGLPFLGIGFGKLNVFKDVQGVIGSRFGDILIGDNKDNFFAGNGGADYINGGRRD